MRMVNRLGALAARVVSRSRIGLAAAVVGGTAALAGATTTEALPTGMTPSDIVTAAIGEAQNWVIAGLAVIIGLALLAALVKGITKKSARPLR
jgi:hypothetical protein